MMMSNRISIGIGCHCYAQECVIKTQFFYRNTNQSKDIKIDLHMWLAISLSTQLSFHILSAPHTHTHPQSEFHFTQWDIFCEIRSISFFVFFFYFKRENVFFLQKNENQILPALCQFNLLCDLKGQSRQRQRLNSNREEDCGKKYRIICFFYYLQIL